MLLFFYILKELIFPFFLASGILLSILLMERIFKFIPLISAIGLDFDIFPWLIIYSLPTICMIAIPLGLIAGVYAGITRLTSDHEITAVKASGLSLSFLFKPTLLLSSSAALFVMLSSFYLSPKGLLSLEKLKFDILKKQTKVNLSVGKINNFPGKMVYISKQENDLFKGVLMADWLSYDNYTIIEAREGKIYFNEEERKVVFNLYRGKIHRFVDDDFYRVVRFGRLNYNFTFFSLSPDSRKLIPGDKSDTQLTINELMERVNTVHVDPDDYLEYADELHSRVTMILSCVCFSILSLTLAIYNPRSSKAGNIVYLGLVLIIYFLAHAQTRNWVVEGKVSPLAIYLPLLPVIFVSFLKYHKLNRNIGFFSQYFVFGRRNRR